MTDNINFRCGYVALLGRPNVGKSTLMNHLIGQKISITSSKPQTTRHRILGIKTTQDYQIVFVDTPGMHLRAKKAVNRYMNRAAKNVLAEVDLIVFVVEASRWGEEDEFVLQQLRQAKVPVILAVNKIDHIKDKTELLPLLAKLSGKMDFAALVPLSALRRNNLIELEKAIVQQLPENPPFYAEDQITDRSSRFIAAEIVREKLMRTLGQELPYELTVQIEQYKEEDGLLNIAAVIWLERDSQKSIVIGKGGDVLKKVGQAARLDMERFFASKVYLQLWVKIKGGWSDDERALSSLGYTEE
ncbi:MAG: GTPase Era [Thiohalomonadaceae bacterium]